MCTGTFSLQKKSTTESIYYCSRFNLVFRMNECQGFKDIQYLLFICVTPGHFVRMEEVALKITGPQSRTTAYVCLVLLGASVKKASAIVIQILVPTMEPAWIWFPTSAAFALEGSLANSVIMQSHLALVIHVKMGAHAMIILRVALIVHVCLVMEEKSANMKHLLLLLMTQGRMYLSMQEQDGPDMASIFVHCCMPLIKQHHSKEMI